MSLHADIAVIGAGPGGYVAALRASQLGAKVICIEKQWVGGVCLNEGCIPTKALLHSAEVYIAARNAGAYGIVVDEPKVDWARVQAHKAKVSGQLVRGVTKLLERAGVQVIMGEATFMRPDTLSVRLNDGLQTVVADKVIIATGSEPARLPMFDFSHPAILTSTEALALRTVPGSLLIVGAGAIGCEFASFYNELGAKITMVEMLPQMLPLEDLRLAKQFQSAYRKRGIQVLLKTKVESITEYADDHVTARLSDGSEITAEKILVSVGRKPNTSGIGLETVGVEVDPRGYVIVNDYLETTAPGVYAIGDVNGGQMLAHVASYEAFVAVDNCLGKRRARDLRSTPSCTYSTPEVASVGLSEEQAVDSGYQPVTGSYRFAALGKAMAMGEETGYVQLVADKETDLLLGASMMGAHVTDVIHEVAVAIQNGLTVSQLGETIHAHPTIAEAIMEAAHDVHGESVHIAKT